MYMDTITRITNKIKELSDSQKFIRIGKIICLALLMTISYTFGKLSSQTGDLVQEKQVQIYLPNGTLYQPNTENINTDNPLSAYILGGATDTIRVPNGPSTTERVTMVQNTPEYNQIDPNTITGTNTQLDAVFGSKNGSTYYVPGCKSGNRVKLENRVYFESETDAEDQGYTRSKLCK
jgi:hypothetical protein